MSAIYNLEPQPTASAIIHTTLGELSVELWAKQTPLACRNFLQLALDGYYDNTIFHRLVPGFILQGGDPTGTGNGGESIYDGGAFSDDLGPWPMDQRQGHNAGSSGVGFKDEFHSRLKFNRRGLLGMANESKPNTNGSQFFFTLDKTEELTSRNTLFGRIAGDTIYNLAKMGESELNPGTDRPTYPVKITSIEIVVNPFEDMQKRQRVALQAEKKLVVQPKKKRKGNTKQLLSFGDELDEGEDLPLSKKPKFDTRIAVEGDEKETPLKTKSRKETKESHRVSIAEEGKVTEAPGARLETIQKEADVPPTIARGKSSRQEKEDDEPRRDLDSSPDPEADNRRSALERTKDEISALKASMRRTVDKSNPTEEVMKKSALESMIPDTSIRGRKRRQGGNAPTREDQKALDLLKAFQSKLDKEPPHAKDQPAGQGASKPEDDTEGQDKDKDKDKDKESRAAEAEEGELCDLHFIVDCQSCKAWDKADKEGESDDEGWMSQALSFKADKLGKDLSYRKKAEEELVVIDPREKARTLQEEKKAEREARAGKTGREWDMARNAKMARSSALAGRGAR